MEHLLGVGLAACTNGAILSEVLVYYCDALALCIEIC